MLGRPIPNRGDDESQSLRDYWSDTTRLGMYGVDRFPMLELEILGEVEREIWWRSIKVRALRAPTSGARRSYQPMTPSSLWL